MSNSISSPKTTTITPITVRIVAINPTFGHGSSRSRKSEATVSTAVITSTAKKSRISGTELTAVAPSNLVTPSVPATSRQFSVTTRRLVTAWARFGVFSPSAPSTAPASGRSELSATKVSRPGISALTWSSGRVSNRWYVWGKLASTAASTSAGASPVTPATSSTRGPTSPAAPPWASTIGSTMSATWSIMPIPTRSPATRSSVNTGRAPSRTRWPASRRGNSSNPQTTAKTTRPATTTTNHDSEFEFLFTEVDMSYLASRDISGGLMGPMPR